MNNIKYEISLKNRLLPFLAPKEISEILNDIESDSMENGDIESIYGKSSTFAKKILKDKRKNWDYIIENVLIICIMIITQVYLRDLPLWIYSVIRVAGYAFLFLGLTKDYLVPNDSANFLNTNRVFWIIEAGMIIIGILLNIFMLMLRSFFEAVENKYDAGRAINIISYSIIGISVLVFIFSIIQYIVRSKLLYGGIIVQTILYIDLVFKFLDRVSVVNTEDGMYVGNYVLAVLLMSVFVIIYYYMRTSSGKKKNN